MFSRTAYVVAIFVWRTNDTFLYYVNKERFAKMPSFNKGSYTEYSNKIGLYSNSQGSFISQSPDVVLNFPYKDCVLEGGMTKEDAKRDERFLNIKLDKRDIDTLFDPKVLTNFKYLDSDGERELSTSDNIKFFGKDGELKQNLLIKGNNLVALHTLKQKLAGKVKLIYIDPPYNTGNDGFKYNDRFNHSSWLVFMKDRLLAARELLQEDGLILVQCDDNEQAYLKVLMDEIFGPNNFINTVIPVMNPRGRQESSYPIARSHEYIHVYSLIQNNATMYQVDKKRLDSADGQYRLLALRKSGNASKREDRPNMFFPIYYSRYGRISVQRTGKDDIEILPIRTIDGVEGRWRWSKRNVVANSDLLVVKLNSAGKYDVYVKDYYAKNGETRGIKLNSFIKEPNIINDRAKEHLAKMFGADVFSFPKSEFLLNRLIELSTKPGDIVLDFCLGSGTTAAVAHKMGRRWIGIEQMDYIETIAKERLKKVIAGEQGGISKSVNWQGGGSFVYLELKKYNQEYVDQINAATNMTELEEVYKKMYQNAFLKFWFDKKTFERDERFRSMDLNTRKQALISILDENQLYLNYADMDDAKYHVSDDERALTKCFYGDDSDDSNDTEAEE